MRTITARLTGQSAFWGSDAGGPCYAFGLKDMLATEHVYAVRLPDGSSVTSRRMFDDCLAIELPDAMQPPATIEIEIMDRTEWCSMQRRTA